MGIQTHILKEFENKILLFILYTFLEKQEWLEPVYGLHTICHG